MTLLDKPKQSAYDAMLRAADADEEKSKTDIVTSPPPEPVAAKGNTFGDYAILQVVSSSASGTTYKAQRRSDGLIASLKVIPKELAKSQEFCKRLKREFELTQGVQHPHVVASYELGKVQGRPYLAFEYVGGADLSRVISELGPMEVNAAVEVCKRIAEGLAYLHGKGIVHRNLKPQNVLVSVQGAVKIANLTMAVEDDARAFLGGHEQNLTVTGQMIGSPDYMAPEQAMDSHRVDQRADLYSLGCTLYHLFTGKPPFGGKNVMQKLQAHQKEPPPSLRAARPDVPPWLDALFQQLLAKSPSERPASAEEVAKRLSGGEPHQWNVALLVAGGIAAAVIAFLAILLLTR